MLYRNLCASERCDTRSFLSWELTLASFTLELVTPASSTNVRYFLHRTGYYPGVQGVLKPMLDYQAVWLEHVMKANSRPNLRCSIAIMTETLGPHIETFESRRFLSRRKWVRDQDENRKRTWTGE